MKEIELKFFLQGQQMNGLKKKVSRLGAELLQKSSLEKNIFFDTKDSALKKTRRILRLRKYGGRSLLTFKKVLPSKKYKIAREYQVEVSSFTQMRRVLKGIGFLEKSSYQKKREIWAFQSCSLNFDILEGMRILEIEGPRAAVEKVINILELKRKEASTKDYGQIISGLKH